MTPTGTTDGTAAGTTLVQAVSGGSPGLAGVDVRVALGKLFFEAAGPVGLRVLNTPTSFPVTLAPNSFFDAYLRDSQVLGGKLVFSAELPASGSELWSTDGTPGGTALILDIEVGSGDSEPILLGGDATRVWFSARTAGTGRELWTTGGTAATTALVVDLRPGTQDGLSSDGLELQIAQCRKAFVMDNGDLLFSGRESAGSGTSNGDRQLFRSDGTAAGTVLVKQTAPNGIGDPDCFIEYAGEILFVARINSTDSALWSTDGTTAGTVKKFNLGSPGGSATLMQSVELYAAFGSLWISATLNGAPPKTGRELFRSDGTAAGTSLVYDFVAGQNNDGLGSLANGQLRVGSEMLFSGTTAEAGAELWVTDGTPAGTRMVADLNPGPSSAFPVFGISLGTRGLFTMNWNLDRRVWASDGTGAGTFPLTAEGEGVNVFNFARLGDLVLYTSQAVDQPGMREVWRTDGTVAGTSQIFEVPTLATLASSGASTVELDGYLYFSMVDSAGDPGIWRTDGSAGGPEFYSTAVAADGVLEQPLSFVRFKGSVWCAAWRFQTGATNLYSFEGGPGGATLALSYPVVSGGFGPSIGGRLLLGGSSQVVGAEPWVTDGTQAGTFLLGDLDPGSVSSQPTNYVRRDDRAYFQTRGSSSAFQTRGSSSAFQNRYWVTDGTPSGTALMPEDQALEVGSLSNVARLGARDEIVFIAETAATGRELWRQDPTTGERNLLPEVYPGPFDSDPGVVLELNGRLIFSAEHPQFGRELFAITLADISLPSATPFGSGCGELTSQAEPDLVGDLRPGGTFELQLQGANPGTTAIWFSAVGPAALTAWGGGCFTFVDLAQAQYLLSAVAGIDGDVRSVLTLPDNPVLPGVALTLQAALVEPGGPFLGNLGLSAALDIVIAP